MINEKYSYKSFDSHGLSFKDVDPKEFSGTDVVGSCFYQEWMEGDKDVAKDVFPDGVEDCRLIRCNLDNVNVPKGFTVVDGTNCLIKVQNDLDDWKLDKDLKPVVPVSKKDRLARGVSIDPKDIPSTKLTALARDNLLGGGVL